MKIGGVDSSKVVIFIVLSLTFLLLLTFISQDRGTGMPTGYQVPRYGREEDYEELPLQFDKKVHEFGEVEAGEQLRTVFTFTNTGNEAVENIQVRATCGCTSTVLTEQDVPPGGSGKIDVVFRTAGQGTGLLTKHVNVMAANQDGMTTLKVTAHVTPTVRMEARPAAVVFDRVPQGESRVQYVSLLHRGSSRPFIRTAYTEADFLEATVQDLGYFRYKLKVELKPDLKPGTYRSVVAVYLASRSLPHISVPVKVVIIPPKHASAQE